MHLFQGGPEVGVSYTLGGYHLSLQWWEYVFIRVVRGPFKNELFNAHRISVAFRMI